MVRFRVAVYVIQTQVHRHPLPSCSTYYHHIAGRMKTTAVGRVLQCSMKYASIAIYAPSNMSPVYKEWILIFLLYILSTFWKMDRSCAFVILTSISLLAVTVCVSPSHTMTLLSCPAVRNVFWPGWEATPHNSSMWPCNEFKSYGLDMKLFVTFTFCIASAFLSFRNSAILLVTQFTNMVLEDTSNSRYYGKGAKCDITANKITQT